MLLANARSDVMFAHYAVRRNIIHAVNITAEGNITCPQGQTSFSVNAPLRASRYEGEALNMPQCCSRYYQYLTNLSPRIYLASASR